MKTNILMRAAMMLFAMVSGLLSSCNCTSTKKSPAAHTQTVAVTAIPTPMPTRIAPTSAPKRAKAVVATQTSGTGRNLPASTKKSAISAPAPTPKTEPTVAAQPTVNKVERPVDRSAILPKKQVEGADDTQKAGRSSEEQAKASMALLDPATVKDQTVKAPEQPKPAPPAQPKAQPEAVPKLVLGEEVMDLIAEEHLDDLLQKEIVWRPEATKPVSEPPPAPMPAPTRESIPIPIPAPIAEKPEKPREPPPNVLERQVVVLEGSGNPVRATSQGFVIKADLIAANIVKTENLIHLGTLRIATANDGGQISIRIQRKGTVTGEFSSEGITSIPKTSPFALVPNDLVGEIRHFAYEINLQDDLGSGLFEIEVGVSNQITGFQMYLQKYDEDPVKVIKRLNNKDVPLIVVTAKAFEKASAAAQEKAALTMGQSLGQSKKPPLEPESASWWDSLQAITPGTWLWIMLGVVAVGLVVRKCLKPRTPYRVEDYRTTESEIVPSPVMGVPLEPPESFADAFHERETTIVGSAGQPITNVPPRNKVSAERNEGDLRWPSNGVST
jgi:hypothetical protein